ncbi:MAG: GYD domain-containing protein [Desulfobacterales bacterium]
MLWVTYGKFSKEGIQGLIAKPQNRAEPVRKMVEALGGKLISHHFVLNGDIDFIIFTDLPNEKLADISYANAMLVRGSGAIETLTTVPAISSENAVSQMKKAQQMAAAMVYEKPTKS